ncbi:MAG TPA: hypothetical protein VJU61_04035 [Polyangiaceae bacterium]|nr:hypothetical protein [Polyangiaceae bacterium]
MKLRALAHGGLALLIVAAIAACDAPAAERPLATPSAEQFELEVYPVLLRDCGFPACHGSSERFFQVFGPGRERLDSDASPFDPPSVAELELSFGRARSMLSARGQPWREARLLRRPLDAAAGGSGHRGEDPWGQNIYLSKEDPGYQTLQRWARSMVDAEAEETR